MGKRYRGLRSLRQVLAAAQRWKWIEDNPAALVKNPEPEPGEIHPFDSWEQIDAIGEELDQPARRWSCSCAVQACGRRRPLAASGVTSTSTATCS